MKRLEQCLTGTTGNYILPFFWLHGEEDAALIREIDAIQRSGIQAVCVESRTHEEFCRDGWWHTMDVILNECERRGMKVWILDDKHFPSGLANRIIPEKYPDKIMWGITERHMDVVGPQKNASVMFQWKTAPEDELLSIVACKCVPEGETLTGETIDLSGGLYEDMVYFDLPEGHYRIFFILKTHSGLSASMRQYTDKLTAFGGDAYLEAVYEPHWEHYSDKFGKTIAGFFSDEPCFGNDSGRWKAGFAEMGIQYTHFPYSDEVLLRLEEQVGAQVTSLLPFLWFPSADQSAPTVRVAYMDIITTLYRTYFSEKLGNWCRAHGVEYIGHIIEDNGQHQITGASAGHYFRALDGQDMAGIDVVLCQVVPGMEDVSNTVPCNYDTADHDFFHFLLGKLGPSHAHIQPEKKSRALCEIYGAYGWAEGLKMMKWLTDFMLVRGINYFVPHAFTPRYPDPDCPPHMFANGMNPQYRRFSDLMAYMNRICHLGNQTHHVSSAAVLYQAEAYWSGGKYMKNDTIARYLTEHQIDFDIVPEDRLATATVRDGRLYVGDADFPCLILPFAQYQPQSILADVARVSADGIPVYCLDALPAELETGRPADLPRAQILALDELADALRASGCTDIQVIESTGPVRFLRANHYRDADADYYMLTNEGIHDEVTVTLALTGFDGDTYVRYDAMKNIAYCDSTDGNGHVVLTIPPYGSVILAAGPSNPADTKPTYPHDELIRVLPHVGQWDISLAKTANYPTFTPYRRTKTLFNITGRDGDPHFSGYMRYETTFCIEAASSDIPETEDTRILLDLGEVGETVHVFVNGQDVGSAITPPFRFDITDTVRRHSANTHTLTVEVINHYGYEMRDPFSKYLLFEPSGILGPVTFEIRKALP